MVSLVEKDELKDAQVEWEASSQGCRAKLGVGIEF